MYRSVLGFVRQAPPFVSDGVELTASVIKDHGWKRVSVGGLAYGSTVEHSFAYNTCSRVLSGQSTPPLILTRAFHLLVLHLSSHFWRSAAVGSTAMTPEAR